MQKKDNLVKETSVLWLKKVGGSGDDGINGTRPKVGWKEDWGGEEAN